MVVETTCICRPDDGHAGQPRNRKSLFGPPRGKGNFVTSYKEQYVPPPGNLYTGISPNLGLKTRVEGVAASITADGLGLGENGKSSYQITHVHMGDAYKDRVRPDAAAKKSRLKMDKGHPGYITSYSVWGSGEGLPIPARPATTRPKDQDEVAPLGYGLDGETIYTTEYKRPQTSKGYIPNKIVSKVDVEGAPEHEVEPYGPLCKSLVQESFRAPPAEAYLKQKSTKPRSDGPQVSNLGLGDGGMTQYQMSYKPHAQEEYLTGARPRTRGGLQPSLKMGGGKLQPDTSYKTAYVPPPSNLYTGISPNLGLKTRVEGVAASKSIQGLGLGENGKSSYQITHVHMGDAYKDRVQFDPAVKKNKLKVDKASPEYTTSYSVWGSGEGLPIPARPATTRPKDQDEVAPLGYGLDGETIYTTEYKRPQTSKGYIPNKIVSKVDVEGAPEHEVEPYGPLCKSLVQESFRAPPAEAYLKKPPKGKIRDPPAVGTVPADRDYGFGEYGITTYTRDYVDKNSKLVCRVCGLPFADGQHQKNSSQQGTHAFEARRG